ncbi:MAG: beta-lactamase family protein [Promicromonosporaceae bacterium]|nr:beta-lactamase family protein [Promicromonosporaceae bacterium]
MSTLTAPLPRTSPQDVRVDPTAVAGLLAALGRLDRVDSVMALRGGKVFAEQWWAGAAPTDDHVMWSVTKTFTATAVGMAIAEGRFAVTDHLVDLLPEDAATARALFAARREQGFLPEMFVDVAAAATRLEALEVRHALSMNTGHTRDTTGRLRVAMENGPSWTASILAEPAEHLPGTHFHYNSGASHLLSAVIQRHTGQSLRDYLTPRLFAPLGIETPQWLTDPGGLNTGGWGLRLRTEDQARFGQLLLQRGRWGETQLVPAEWVSEMFTAHSDNSACEWGIEAIQGYGYQAWKCSRGDAWRADGMFGQYVVVWPEHDVVIAVNAQMEGDMHQILAAIWQALPDAAFG